MRSLLALMFLTVALAGCFADDPAQAPTDDDTPAPAPYVSPFTLSGQENHTHGDPSMHDIANNITLVGHHPLGDNGPPGAISEIDVAGHHAFLGVMGYGFLIVDLEDPANPQLVSSVEVLTPDHSLPACVSTCPYLADLKVDSSGDWVFVALELSSTPGVLIYDVRDKENPQFAGFWPEPGLLLGCHMIEYAVIAEQEYLFCAPLDNAVYVGLLLPPVETPQGAVREVAQVARWVPDTPAFIQAELDNIIFRAQNGDASAVTHLASFHQDMTHQMDPLTGDDILTVSFWNLGLHFVDVSIPAAPRGIGSWMGVDAQKFRGVLHTSMTFKSVGADGQDKRIAVTIPEGANPPAMFVVDATDMSDPQIISEWAAHEDFEGESGTFSMHNFQIIDGKVYMMMYHGGFGLFDISTSEKQQAPQMLASYHPWDRAGGGLNSSRWGRGCCGGSWDVVVYQGYPIMANGGGIFVVKYDHDIVGPEGKTSFA